MAHDLQPEQAACDGAGPQEKEEADNQKRDRLRGTPLGVWERLRMGWTAAGMSTGSDAVSYCAAGAGGCHLGKRRSGGGWTGVGVDHLARLRLGESDWRAI